MSSVTSYPENEENVAQSNLRYLHIAQDKQNSCHPAGTFFVPTERAVPQCNGLKLLSRRPAHFANRQTVF